MNRPLAVLGTAVLLIGGTGCQDGVVKYLDEIDFLPKREKLSEVSLGSFVIPIPAKEHESGIDLGQQKSAAPARNRLQILFEVYAVVSPRDEAKLIREWERQQGRYRYEVLRICREATLEEVSEPDSGDAQRPTDRYDDETVGNQSGATDRA